MAFLESPRKATGERFRGDEVSHEHSVAFVVIGLIGLIGIVSIILMAYGIW